MRHIARLAVALTIALLSGCAGIHANSVPHCILAAERSDARQVFEQWVVAEVSGDYPNLMSHMDHLTAYCIAVNTARGD